MFLNLLRTYTVSFQFMLRCATPSHLHVVNSLSWVANKLVIFARQESCLLAHLWRILGSCPDFRKVELLVLQQVIHSQCIIRRDTVYLCKVFGLDDRFSAPVSVAKERLVGSLTV